MQLSPMILTFTQLGDDHRPFRESLQMCRDSGYDEISLLHLAGGPVVRPGIDPDSSFIDVFRSDWNELRARLAAAGLRCRHVHAGRLDVTSDESTATSAAQLAGLAALAHNFGAEVMTFGVGPRRDPPVGGDERTAYLDRVATAFSTVDRELAGLPITLGIDIHFRAPVETVADASYVIEHSGQRRVGLCLNVGHLRSADQDGWELIRRYPDAVHVVAYKDHTESGAVHSVRLGAGDTPLVKYLAALHELEIEPFQVVSIEHEPWNAKEESARESRDHLLHLSATLAN